MLIYILILCYLFIFGAIFLNIKNNKIQTKFVIFSMLILTIISAIRASNVGADTLQYYTAFNCLSSFNELNFDIFRYEKGFTFFMWIIHKFSKDPQILLITTSLIVNYGIGRFIMKNSNNKILSLILYFICNFFFSYMNIMRQAIAISIILFGFEFLKKDKKILFIIFTLLASFFHFSAVLALLYIPLKKLKYNKNMILIVIIISFICFIFGNNIFNYLGNISIRLNGYIDSKYYSQNYFGALIEFVLNFLSFALGVHIIKKYNPKIIKDKSDSLNLILGIIAINVVFYALIMKVSIFNRFSPYFSIFNIVWIPNYLNLIQNRRKKLFYSLIIVGIYTAYFLSILIYRPQWYLVIPYKIYN